MVSMSHGVPVYSSAHVGTRLYCLHGDRGKCVTDLPKVALDTAEAGIEPAISPVTSPTIWPLATYDSKLAELQKSEPVCHGLKISSHIKLQTVQ